MEDKARLVDATFRPWWIMLIFAGVAFIWFFGIQSVPRRWHWWSSVALVVAILVLSLTSSVIQWRSLVHSGVARNYVRTQLRVFIILYVAMLLYLAVLLYDVRLLLPH